MPESAAHEPDRVTWFIRRGMPLFVVVALLGLVVRRSAAALTNDDTFFHLRFGREFLDGWSIADPGQVSTLSTRDWAPTQWAAQLLMAGAEDWFGLPGVAWLAGAVLAAYVVALYVACRDAAAPLVAALVTLLAFLASGTGLSARPQLVSYLLTVVVTAAWLRTARDARLRWWLIPLTWAWATLHGMWPIALVVGFSAVVGLVLDGQGDRKWRIKAVSIPIASALAAAATPVGPRLYADIAQVGSRSSYFEEWGPTDFTSLAPLFVATLMAVTLLVLLRTGPATWTTAALLLLAGAWALYSSRTVPVAAAMVAPLAAAALQSLQRPSDRPSRPEKGFLTVAFAGALAVLALAVTRVGGPDRPGWEEPALDELSAGTVLLNEWDWGGYLMWSHPDLNLVMHGYGDVFTDDELDRNVDITTLKPGWDEQVEATGAEIALLAEDSRLAYVLEHSLGWRVVEYGEGAVLLEAPGR